MTTTHTHGGTDAPECTTCGTREQEAIAAIQQAVRQWAVRFSIVRTFSGVDAVQVEAQVYQGTQKRWKKAGPLLFPPEGGTLADTLKMLGEMRAESILE